MSEQHTPGPWAIEWYVCRMDKSDVEHAKKDGNANAKVGDELWRLPLSIGPISANHNHWAGNHLDCDVPNARLIAAAPDLLKALQDIAAYYPNSWASDAARAAIAKVEGGGV